MVSGRGGGARAGRRVAPGIVLVLAGLVLAAGCGGGPPSVLPLVRADRIPPTTIALESTTTLPLPVPSPTVPVPTLLTTTTAKTKPTPQTTITLPPALRLPTPATTATTAAPARPGSTLATDAAAYAALGTWADVYDWSRSYTNNKPSLGPGDVDRMASAGVQTLFIQAAFHDHPNDIVDADLLSALLERARARGIRVIAWYLPTLVDPNHDLRRTLAVAQLPVDGIAIDIEARNVKDVAERNRRLVAYSAALRQSLPGRTIGGIVLPPVLMEVVNTNYWPAYPWRGIAPYYDVWLPMSYWTERTNASGYKDGYRYTAENILRMRNNLGLPAAPVHTIGGIANAAPGAHVDGMVRAAHEHGALGGSLYDWRTTGADLYPHLQPFRS